MEVYKRVSQLSDAEANLAFVLLSKVCYESLSYGLKAWIFAHSRFCTLHCAIMDISLAVSDGLNLHSWGILCYCYIVITSLPLSLYFFESTAYLGAGIGLVYKNVSNGHFDQSSCRCRWRVGLRDAVRVRTRSLDWSRCSENLFTDPESNLNPNEVCFTIFTGATFKAWQFVTFQNIMAKLSDSYSFWLKVNR